jgi:RimJ/RimL family protein N-acetyltransferase
MMIRTNRLALSPITTNDAHFIYRLMNTDGWLAFIGDRKIDGPATARNYIEQLQRRADCTYWVVRLQSANIPIGLISFLKRDYLEFFDIGFAFLPEYARHGYAHEASEAVLHRMMQDPQHHTVQATTLPSNQASINLLGKLGFQFLEERIDEDIKFHVFEISRK